MKIRMTTNLGARDAKNLGTEPHREGNVVDVETRVGEALIKRGWATDAAKATNSQSEDELASAESSKAIKRTSPNAK